MNEVIKKTMADAEQPIPDWQLHEYVSACLQWHQDKGRWAHSVLDDDEVLTVGLAMRDKSMLHQRGYSVEQAFAVIRWPESLSEIRKEVLLELDLRERQNAKCEFNDFDPAIAKRSIPRVESAIRRIEKEIKSHGESEDQDKLTGLRDRLVFLQGVVTNCSKTETE